MKILIVSDTHGNENNLEKVLEQVGSIDRLIHLGDVEGAENYIRALTDAEVDMVAGNNDYFADLPAEMILTLGDYRALITHGHYYYVSRGPERLINAGREKGVDIVMFGHTHYPYLDVEGDITVLNPGSLTLPRQPGREPSYIVMEIDANGETHYEICYLKSARRIF